jgi:hypothetical protein
LGRVRRSTLADANATRPAALFAEIAAKLAGELGGRRQAVRLIDATRLFAGKRIESWAAGGAVKLHVVFDPDGGRPAYFAVTPERRTDLSAARGMPVESGATYVFDKGYLRFQFLGTPRCGRVPLCHTIEEKLPNYFSREASCLWRRSSHCRSCGAALRPALLPSLQSLCQAAASRDRSNR